MLALNVGGKDHSDKRLCIQWWSVERSRNLFVRVSHGEGGHITCETCGTQSEFALRSWLTSL